MHAEAGKGQFEFALGHTVCLNAADNLVYTREVIRATARKHGLLATFMPKYVLGLNQVNETNNFVLVQPVYANVWEVIPWLLIID